MCQQCPNLDDPQKTAEMAEYSRTGIKAAMKIVDQILKLCVNLEDEYRRIGLFYHTTEYESRAIMAAMPLLSDDLVHLEDYFQLSDPAEYDEWSDRLATAIEKASKLRADMLHIPRQASPERLVYEYNHAIYPAFQDLRFVVENERGILKQLALEVNQLRTIEMNREDRPRSWWCFNYNSQTGRSEMEHQGEEWNNFLNWVSCLPETRNAMQQGQHIHDIARRWIRREDGVSLSGLLTLEDGRVITENTA